MTGFLSITFLLRSLYCTTQLFVVLYHLFLCSKPVKDRFYFHAPKHCTMDFQSYPFFGVGTAKVETYFLLTKSVIRKSLFFEDFLCSLLSALHHLFITALGDPFIQVADAKVITYFILTKYLIIYFFPSLSCIETSTIAQVPYVSFADAKVILFSL